MVIAETKMEGVMRLVVALFMLVYGSHAQTSNDIGFSVRIVGGPSPRQGRVEIYFEEQWGTVSLDDEWTDMEAVVVCRQLGFDGPAARVEPKPATVAFDIPTLSVDCPEGASSLTDCQIQKTAGSEQEASHSYLDGLPNWDHSQIAGVKCENAVAVTVVTAVPGPNVAQIAINVVGILVVIAVICLFGALFYRFKKRKSNKPPEAARQESVPMYSTTIEKNYAEIGEDEAQQYITVEPTEEEQAQQYITIDPPEVEPENSDETPIIK